MMNMQYKKKILVMRKYCSCIALVRTALWTKSGDVVEVSSRRLEQR